mmetsp:Transcript_59741/g.134370  ORF Transcript_59741/g.134370 Transcript_59741/m.134370 type:complete len:248 (-) Transcript_59741:59-802(-)
MLGQGRAHDADRARTSDQNVLADEVEGQGRVRCIAERVEERGHLVGHLRGQGEGVLGWNAEELCEGALAVHAHADRAPAEVPDASTAVPAVAADDVALAAHAVAHLEALHALADLHDRASELVTDGHALRYRLLRPLVPVVDVHVSAADRRSIHLDEHIVVAGPGHRLAVHPDPSLGLGLRKRLHGGPRVDGLVPACAARAAPGVAEGRPGAGLRREPARPLHPARDEPAPADAKPAGRHGAHRTPY